MTITSDAGARLGWNLAAGVASTSWTALVALATVPLYLRYLGIEAYGLIGFFTAMQALFALLEVGLAQTVNREVARTSTLDERRQARDLLHTLAVGYWAVAALIALITWAAAPLVARYWLTSAAIPAESVSRAVMLMGLIVACRFPLSLYLGALMGARRMVLASGIEIVMVTLANLGAIAILALLSRTIQAFFVWQALVGLLNVAVVRAAAWRAIRMEEGASAPRFDATGLRRIWRFSAAIAVTAILGTLFVQGDKVILSKIVSLGDLGRYTLAGIAARSLYVLVAPVFGVIYPQMAALHAAGDTDEIERLYRSGTRLMMAAIFPVAFFIGVFSTDIFTLWTGDVQLAERIGTVVRLLLFGTALNGAMHFPYALQLAYGKSNLAMAINLTLVIIFAPLLVLLSVRHGITGAAAAWAILNFLYLVLGTWLTHRTMLRGLGTRWILADVGIPFLIGLVLVGGGGVATQHLHLELPARMFFGVLLTGVAFLAVYPLSPGLAGFASRLFTPQSTLLSQRT